MFVPKHRVCDGLDICFVMVMIRLVPVRSRGRRSAELRSKILNLSMRFDGLETVAARAFDITVNKTQQSKKSKRDGPRRKEARRESQKRTEEKAELKTKSSPSLW